MASRSPFRLTIFAPRFPWLRSSKRCARPRANWRSCRRRLSSAATPPADIWPPACLATDWKAYDASLPSDLVRAAYAISGLFDLPPLVETSINKALRLDQARLTPQARCSGSPHPRQPRRGGGRGGKRGISPAKPKHRRGLGQGRRRHPIRRRSRRQSFHRDCAARRSRFLHDLAPEGTGGHRQLKADALAVVRNASVPL